MIEKLKKLLDVCKDDLSPEAQRIIAQTQATFGHGQAFGPMLGFYVIPENIMNKRANELPMNVNDENEKGGVL